MLQQLETKIETETDRRKSTDSTIEEVLTRKTRASLPKIKITHFDGNPIN